MLIRHLSVRNWKNFRSLSVDLGDRIFLAGPNASGKSNLLDVFKFLRDLTKQGGGLQKAVQDRGGISKIRCLAARRNSDIEIEAHLGEGSNGAKLSWKYAIGFRQESRGYRRTLLSYERVWQGEEMILQRPDESDQDDTFLLTQTHLEQINANRAFRPISEFFDSVLYLHLVPQLVRHARDFTGPGVPGDPFGKGFLERVAKTPKNVQRKRLQKIEALLKVAVPQLESLVYNKDKVGFPHLEAKYKHWRPSGAIQREDQFSDGTLRLIGLLWSLLESDSLLLLEEPELSLNAAIVMRLAGLMWRVQKAQRRQVIISTHSADLLLDRGIGPEEVLLLSPSPEGTKVMPASSNKEIKALLEGGLSMGEIILPYISPTDVRQLELFE